MFFCRAPREKADLHFVCRAQPNKLMINGDLRRRLARGAIEHAFKRPHGNTLQSADLDHGDFSAGCGVVGGVAAETEIKPSGLRDGNRQRSILVSHDNPQTGDAFR
jgi:hypothetical protein